MKAIYLICFVLCVTSASPAACISRWFTATFNDLKFTLHRYGYCLDGVNPVTNSRFNETEYLIEQIKTFLSQGDYTYEHLGNVSNLMDTICRTSEPSYAISVNVDIKSFNSSTNPAAKSVRCRAIDEAMDSMYHVFKRVALNRSEPLDFSSIVFYPNETDKSANYSLSDLINTSWITSEVVLEHVCNITGATKAYIQERTIRRQGPLETTGATSNKPPGLGSWFVWFFDRMLEPVLGLQRRLYWEGSNRLESIQARLNSGLLSLRNGFGGLLSRTNSTSNSRLTTMTTRPPRLSSTRANFTDISSVSWTSTSTTPFPSSKATVSKPVSQVNSTVNV